MILFNDLAISRQLAAAAATNFNPDCDVSIGRVEDGRLLGGMIYTDFTGASIGMHIASFDPHWVDRSMLWIAFDYPFNQLKVNKIFGQVPASNAQALAFDLHVGFKVEARIKDVFPDGDLILVSMYRDDCKWLRMRPPRSEVFRRAA